MWEVFEGVDKEGEVKDSFEIFGLNDYVDDDSIIYWIKED